jgi:hypothetical protein
MREAPPAIGLDRALFPDRTLAECDRREHHDAAAERYPKRAMSRALMNMPPPQ